MSPYRGGDERVRTDDPLLAKQVLSQLSYTPAYLIEGLAPSKLNNDLSFEDLTLDTKHFCFFFLHRKEVIQPHLPIRLPCYDLTPIIEPTFGCCLLAVSSQTSGIPDFHGLTGGVYKARERIHRSMLICDY